MPEENPLRKLSSTGEKRPYPQSDQDSERTAVYQNNEDNTVSFELLRDYFDKNFSAMQNKIDLDTKQMAKRLKSKPGIPEFKFKGNKIQYQFNLNLVEALDEVTSARRLCFHSEVQKRNKLIRLADRSAGGWATVQEYLSDDLASDSDD